MNWKLKYKMIVSVYLILIDDKGQVLLLKRQNTGFKDGEYGLPAGHVDGGEDLYTAMQREAKEEVGVNIEKEDLHFVHVMHRNCGDHERIDVFFECCKWKGDVTNCEPEKCSELKWYSRSELPEDFIDYYRRCFEHVDNGSCFSHFGFE